MFHIHFVVDLLHSSTIREEQNISELERAWSQPASPKGRIRHSNERTQRLHGRRQLNKNSIKNMPKTWPKTAESLSTQDKGRGNDWDAAHKMKTKTTITSHSSKTE